MPYCVKCGVELNDSEKKCPLCKTKVYHPDLPSTDGKTPYPPYVKEHEPVVNKTGTLFILTVLYLTSIIFLTITNLNTGSHLSWARYPVGGLTLLYIFFVLPLWFRKPKKLILAGVDFIAIGLYLLWINSFIGGNWFLTFALPATGGLAIVVITFLALMQYFRISKLFIIGGAIMSLGGYTILLEYLINVTFKDSNKFIWSLYPLIFCFMLGIALIVIEIHKPLKDALAKKFFV